jgi:hypothetical protein
MALVTCPECSSQVSDKATSCPKCGCPISVAQASLASNASVASVRQEDTVFADQHIRVTTARAVFGNQTFSMANVSSVSVFRDDPGRALPILLIVGGLLGGMTCVESRSAGAAAVTLLLLGVGGMMLWLQKPVFWIKIIAAGGETRPFSSKDKPYIERIVQALNEAMVRRG